MKHHSKSHQHSNNNSLKVNRDISAETVLVITGEGQSFGPCSIKQALQMAEDTNLDLVEVSPNTNPPVCKILDYGKFKYSQNKKNKNTVKKKQGLKEIRMQPKISEHDLLFKKNHVQQFLSEGNKVKISIRFKGRELAHPEIGEQVLRKIISLISINFHLDKEPTMEGRSMSVLLSPVSKSQSAKQANTTKSTDSSTDSHPATDVVSNASEQNTEATTT